MKKWLLFVFCLLFSILLFCRPPITHAQSSFVFTANGDHGEYNKTETVQSWNAIKNSGAVFSLALGDMSYESGGTEQRWCTTLQNILGSSYPFQLIVGNHEDEGRVDGYIGEFVKYCPDRLNSAGAYAAEYYFDYPQSNPLVRVIMIGADNDYDVDQNGSVSQWERFVYDTSNASNTEHYNWLSATIDGARNSGIQWVVVGMHKNCLTVGNKPCEIGSQLLNLLVSKKVDLVLQGHDHDYQRSKQLAHGSGCNSISPGSVNSNCIADSGADDHYVKGAGTIFMINGNFGGGGFTNINPGDSEVGYFAKAMGGDGWYNFNVSSQRNSNSSRGVSKFTVTSSSITVDHVKTSNTSSTFSEHFVISSSGTPPTPAPTPSLVPSPSSSPQPTPSATPAPSSTPPPTTPPEIFPDVNADGRVDLVDFFVWLSNYGQVNKTITSGDFSADGKINLQDFARWYQVFTQGASSPAPSPSSSIGSFQPTAPYYATFYYQWYKTPATDGGWSYWTDHGNNPPNTWFSKYLPDPKPDVFDPATELYSPNDYNNFKWQVAKMAEARLEVAIASWFGPGTKEDTAFNNIINDFMGRNDNPYPNLRWAIYYEDEGFSDPTVSTIVNDLNHIKNNYAQSPYFMRVNGKPVIFVYADASDGSAMAQRWKDANTQLNSYFYVVLKLFSGYTSVSYQPDSWHQYAPATRSGTHAPYSAYVSPGFWLDDGSSERLPRNATEFENAVQSMVSANVTWKMVQTWNEWGEGTSIEPGTHVRFNASSNKDEPDPNGYPFGNLYIDILKNNLPPLEAGTGR